MNDVPDTVEKWAEGYLLSDVLSYKLSPAQPPSVFDDRLAPHRLQGPGRPPELRRMRRAAEIPRDLREPAARAKLLHTFLHHELQAAELLCWAILAFSRTELEFRRGLLRICVDEIRHLGLYRARLEELGYQVGQFKVRDWLWERVPSCETPLSFVALMHMGIEGANLEHAERFSGRFSEAGDEASARLVRTIGRDEIAHVAFGVHWFERWSSTPDFNTWKNLLPPPLSPLLLRGKVLARSARLRAQMNPRFLDEFEAWQP